MQNEIEFSVVKAEFTSPRRNVARFWSSVRPSFGKFTIMMERGTRRALTLAGQQPISSPR